MKFCFIHEWESFFDKRTRTFLGVEYEAKLERFRYCRKCDTVMEWDLQTEWSKLTEEKKEIFKNKILNDPNRESISKSRSKETLLKTLLKFCLPLWKTE